MSESVSEAKPRDLRPYIYAALCLGLAVVYLILFRSTIPSKHAITQVMAYSMVVVMVANAVALLVRQKWSWWVGVVGSGYMVLVCILLFFVLIHSAAFLSGVYGAFGKGAAGMLYLAAALIVEIIALIPALLMKYLMTRAGRRQFGLEPLWNRG